VRKVEAHSLDSIADYRLVEASAPTTGENEVTIEVAVCGVGYVDALVALGRYQVKPPLPYTPGQEVGGRILEVGAKVRGLAPGDRVMASVRGGFAEVVSAAAGAVAKIPDAMSFVQAAGFRINYITALHGLRDRARLQPGERLLVLGAAGGVGMAAIQVGKRLGATVVAAASTEEKRAFALAHGADVTIDTSPEGWRDRLKEACGGKGPDVVFDPVCGPLFELAFRSLAWRGRHLVVGFAGGPIPALPANLTLMKGAALAGVDVRQFLLFEGDRAAAQLSELLSWVADDTLAPPVGRAFQFEEFAEALEFALSGQGVGKTVLIVNAEQGGR
jgi:NADPH2:quinone reductase